MKIEIGKKIIKIGNSYYVTVPIQLIKSRVLDKQKTYNFSVDVDD